MGNSRHHRGIVQMLLSLYVSLTLLTSLILVVVVGGTVQLVESKLISLRLPVEGEIFAEWLHFCLLRRARSKQDVRASSRQHVVLFGLGGNLHWLASYVQADVTQLGAHLSGGFFGADVRKHLRDVCVCLSVKKLLNV